jgi:hypothetical protein
MRSNRDLAAVLGDLAVTVDPSRRDTVADLLGRLAAGRLRVAVVGEAKRGKSTLINALLGQPVLPAGVTPLTAVATMVRHGTQPRVEARYRDGPAPPTTNSTRRSSSSPWTRRCRPANGTCSSTSPAGPCDCSSR